jgi:hypothetical protein
MDGKATEQSVNYTCILTVDGYCGSFLLKTNNGLNALASNKIWQNELQLSAGWIYNIDWGDSRLLEVADCWD